MRELGKNIRTLREGRGMTQDSFAELLHVTRQTVSNYENGRSQPDLDMLAAIARVLDTDVNALLGAGSNKKTVRHKMNTLEKLTLFLLASLILSCFFPWFDYQAIGYGVLGDQINGTVILFFLPIPLFLISLFQIIEPSSRFQRILLGIVLSGIPVGILWLILAFLRDHRLNLIWQENLPGVCPAAWIGLVVGMLLTIALISALFRRSIQKEDIK